MWTFGITLLVSYCQASRNLSHHDRIGSLYYVEMVFCYLARSIWLCRTRFSSRTISLDPLCGLCDSLQQGHLPPWHQRQIDLPSWHETRCARSHRWRRTGMGFTRCSFACLLSSNRSQWSEKWDRVARTTTQVEEAKHPSFCWAEADRALSEYDLDWNSFFESQFAGMQSSRHLCRSVCSAGSVQWKHQITSSSWCAWTFCSPTHELDPWITCVLISGGSYPYASQILNFVTVLCWRSRTHCAQILAARWDPARATNSRIKLPTSSGPEYHSQLTNQSRSFLRKQQFQWKLHLVQRGPSAIPMEERCWWLFPKTEILDCVLNPLSKTAQNILRCEPRVREQDRSVYWPRLMQRMIKTLSYTKSRNFDIKRIKQDEMWMYFFILHARGLKHEIMSMVSVVTVCSCVVLTALYTSCSLHEWHPCWHHIISSLFSVLLSFRPLTPAVTFSRMSTIHITTMLSD